MVRQQCGWGWGGGGDPEWRTPVSSERERRSMRVMHVSGFARR